MDKKIEIKGGYFNDHMLKLRVKFEFSLVPNTLFNFLKYYFRIIYIYIYIYLITK